MTACFAFLLITYCSLFGKVFNVHTFGDEEVHARIPEDLKKEVEKLVQEKLDEVISVHYNPEHDVISTSRHQMVHTDFNPRVRRQVNANISSIYSEWSNFGLCSVKCGGGVRFRTRTCLSGNCTSDSLMEQQECGTLPCVAGSFTLEGFSPVWKLSLSEAKQVKFFTILNEVYLGKLTESAMQVFKYNGVTDTYVVGQTIPVQKGISFTIMRTELAVFLVILEKSTGYFQGAFSRMYPYDPLQMYGIFDVARPTRFLVYEPSAVTAFQIYGKPYMAVVNYRDKVISAYGAPQKAVVCNGQYQMISCPSGTYISILDAIYGRFNNWECSPGQDFMFAPQYFYWCIVNGVKDKVISLCDNKPSCNIEASNDLIEGQDPCSYTIKYLKIFYTCSTLSYETMPLFYRWDGVGLSVVSNENLKTYGPKDLESFHIHEKAYVVAANYVNDQQQHHLDSEIFVYNLEKRRFQSFQKLRTDGAIDFEFFTVGQGISREYFLAVANHIKAFPDGRKSYEVDSVIYKWNWNRFVPFQCIATNGALKWTAVSGSDGEFTLSLLDIQGNITFYIYNGWRFHKHKLQPTDEIFKNAVSTTSTTTRSYGKYRILFAIEPTINMTNLNNVYSLQFTKIFPRFDILESTLQAVQEMKRTIYETIIPRAESLNVTFNEIKDKIVFVDDVTTISGLNFERINVEGVTTVINATANVVNLSPADLAKQNLQNVHATKIQQLSANISQAESILSNVVTKSTNQQITGDIVFEQPVSIHQLNTNGNIYVAGNINNKNLLALYLDAILIDKDVNFTHAIRFTENVTFDSMLVRGTINSILLDDVITTNSPQDITGVKIFEDIQFAENIIQNINVRGLVNGINTTHLVLLNNDQQITAEHRFLENTTVQGDLVIEGLLNGMNISYIVKDTMLKNESGVITSLKRFNSMELKVDLEIADGKTINGVDVSNLTVAGVFLNAAESFGNVTITGNVTFKSPIQVGGELNKESFDSFIFTSKQVIFQHPMTFTKNITCFKNTNVSGLINGLNIPGDVLDTFSNQTITGTTTFQQDVTLLQNLNVGETIDGVNLSKLYADSMLFNKTQVVSGHKSFKKMTSSNVTLEECDGADCDWLKLLKDLETNTVKKTSKNVSLKGEKIFMHGVNLKQNLTVTGKINGESFPGALWKRGSSDVVSSKNTFKNVTFSNVTTNRVNEFNITEVYENTFMKKGSTQVITGNWAFYNDISFNSGLHVNGTIDGVNLTRDAVFTNENYTFTGRKTFKNDVHVDTLIVGNMTVDKLIDGVNLTALKEELVILADDIIIKGKKIFLNHVSFSGNWTIPGLIDGVNISDLDRRAMKLDTDQVITGKKIFQKPVQVKNANLEVDGLVDGVNLTDFAKKAVFKNYSNVLITQNITTHNITIEGNLNTNGLVNGLNLTQLFEDALKRNGDQSISGFYNITNFNIGDGLMVKNLINKINFTEEVIQIDQSVEITGSKYFRNGIQAMKIITDTINNVNLQEFLDTIVYVDQNATLTGNKTFSSLRFSDIDVHGLVSNINWTELATTTLLKDGDQTVRVPTHFDKIILQGDSTITNLINGVNLTEFEKNVIYKCYGSNRPITGYHKYDDVIVNGSSTVINVTTSGTVNGINVTKLAKDTVYVNGNHTIIGKKHVKKLTVNNLDVGTINGFTVPDDFVGVNEENVIVNGSKIFKNDVKILGNARLPDNKTVNGYDLSELKKNMVTVNGSQSVITDVEFSGTLTVNKNLNVGLLNNVNVSKDNLLLKNYDQRVTGKKTLRNISTKKEVFSQNHINGFDLGSMVNESIVSGVVNEITGQKIIQGNVVITGNLNTNLIDNVNVSTLFSELTKISNYLDHSLNDLNNTIIQTQNRTNALSGAITNIHQKIDYFLEDDEIPLNYKSISLDIVSSKSEAWLVAGALTDVHGVSCTNTSVFYRFNGTFKEYAKVLTSAVTGLRIILSAGNLTLLTASNRPAANCISGLDSTKFYSIGYSYNSFDRKFERAFSIDTGKSKYLDTKTENGSIKTVFTNLESVNKPGCAYQTSMIFKNGAKLKEVKFGNYTCKAIKSFFVKSDASSSMIAVLGSDIDLVNHLAVYTISHQTEVVNLLQYIPTYHASDVISLQTSMGLYLVVANTYDSSSEALSVSYAVPVSVYKYDEPTKKFDLYQELDIYAAYLLAHFKYGSFDYLAIATLDQNVIVLRHKGINKWQQELIIPARGYNSVKAINFWVDSNDDLYLILLTDDEWDDIFPSKIKIAKAVMSSNADGDDIAKILNI